MAALQKYACLLAGSWILALWPVATQAQADFPHAQVTWSGGAGMAELHIDGDKAAVSLRTADGKLSQLREIDTVDDALAILADERLSFAWPALLAWAGDDLHILRDRALNRAVQAANGEVKPLPLKGRDRMYGGTKQFLAFSQYMAALERSGLAAYAITRIQARLAAPAKDDDPDVRSALQTMLASHLFNAGTTARAITVLMQASTQADSAASRVNVNVAAAKYLAQMGQYDWALKIVDGTQYDEKQLAAGFRVLELPDSNAIFVAVRACALNGLGHTDEARTALARIVREPVTTSDLSVKAKSRLFAFACMHDAAGLANELAAQIQTAPPTAQVLLQFQPAAETVPAERATLVAALATDIATKAMAGRVRVLSGSLSSAVSAWRDAFAPPSP